MKNTKKVIFTSIATIGMSAALIGGATFALFTSENATNIAVTSGKVNVGASITKVEAYSAKWDEESNNYIQDSLHADDGEGYSYTFANSGTVVYDADSNLLAIDRITAGDGVKLNIAVTNESTVSIRYQTRVVISYPEDTAVKLGNVLDITVDGKKSTSAGVAFVSGWSDPIEKSQAIDDISVEISMPWEAGNEYQGLKCNIAVILYAIQGNASADTPIADALVNSTESLQEALNNIEDGDVIGLLGDIEISGDDELVIPENTDVSFDLSGKSLDVSNKKEADGDGEAYGQGLVVSKGSTLTLTDTSSNEEERGSFNLNVDVNANNLNDHENGSYAMRVDGGTLNIENIDFTINNDQEDCHSIYVDGGTVNVSKDANIEINADNFGFGFYISNGSQMNIDGGNIYSDGRNLPLTVGGGENESALNFNSGYLKYENATDSAVAIQVYPKGMVNIHDGVTIEVCGDVSSEDGSAYSNAIAVGSVGGGNFNMDGGEILLNVKNGTAFGTMILNNTYWESGNDSEYYDGIILNAHFVFSGNSAIKATTGNGYGNAYIFATQRNGKQTVNWDLTAYNPIELAEGDAMCTIILRDKFSATINGAEVAKTNTWFGYTGGSANNLNYYTKDAIKDER